jgi:hypothetical protein
VNGAHATFFEEKIRVSIEKGKLANLLIISEVRTKVCPEKIGDIQVIATMTGGISVFESRPIKLSWREVQDSKTRVKLSGIASLSRRFFASQPECLRSSRGKFAKSFLDKNASLCYAFVESEARRSNECVKQAISDDRPPKKRRLARIKKMK